MSSAKVPNLTKGPNGEFRWTSNNAVVPPQWLADEGIQFDAELQYREFRSFAEVYNDWFVRMPQTKTTEADRMTMFVDYALGKNQLRPAIGEDT